MVSTSADFKTAIAETDREIRAYLRFNGDDTKRMRGCDGLCSIAHYAQIADSRRPMFGCACSAYCTVEFFNSGASGISLANSYFDAYIGVVLEDTGTAPAGSIEPDTATVEYVLLGRFWISDVQQGDLKTSVTAYDAFSRLNKEYVPTVTADANGYAIKDILNDIRVQCSLGFNPTTASLGYVDKIYSGTCREVLGWVLNMSTNYYGANLIVGRSSEIGAYAVRRLATQWANKDDYTITDQTTYLDGLDKQDDFTVSSVVSGTENDPVSVGSGTGIVGENPYMTNARATDIYNAVNGITFTPMTISFRGDPAFVVGDVVKVTHGADSYYCYTQKISTIFNGGLQQTIECYGDTEYYYSMHKSPTQAQIRTVSNMAQEIQQEIETARNGVCTQILDTDGTWKEFVIADNVDLSAATSVWRWNINGLAHSTAYSGGTYSFAVDMQGRIIASAIQTGILKDAANKNSWNLDTGALTITDGSIDISTSSSTSDKIQLSYSSGGNEYSTRISPATTTIEQENSLGQKWSANYAAGNISIHYRATSSDPLDLRSTLSINYLTFSTDSNTENGRYGGDGFTIFHDGSPSKYSARLFKSSGEGILTLHDGTSTTARVRLGNSALTFYDALGTETASYPSTGQQIIDSTDIIQGANLVSGTQTDVRSITLQPGKYILHGYVCFNANATGVRVISVSYTSGSYAPANGWNARQSALPSGWYTTCNVCMPVNLTTAKTLYLVAYQNSGSALGMTDYELKAVKLL